MFALPGLNSSAAVNGALCLIAHTNTLTVKRPLTPSHAHFWASVCVFVSLFIYLALDTFTFGSSVKLLWNIMYFEKYYTNKHKNIQYVAEMKIQHSLLGQCTRWQSLKKCFKTCHILTNIFFVFMLFSNGFKNIFFYSFGMKKNKQQLRIAYAFVGVSCQT